MEREEIREIIESYPFYKVFFLKEFLTNNNVWFRKSKGQNFLIDKNYVYKFFDEISKYQNEDIIEIGGGSGNLSILLSFIAKNLFIFEIDSFFASILRIIFDGKDTWIGREKKDPDLANDYMLSLKEKFNDFRIENKCKIEILQQDFISFFDFFIENQIEKSNFEKFVIVGNIPYNISTQILTKISKNKDITTIIYLTTQKEYFVRISGKENRSFLTIFADYHFIIDKIFDLPPSAFYPKPEVESTFFSLKPKRSIFDDYNEKLFFKFVSKAFSSKRKMLINNFSKMNKMSRTNESRITESNLIGSEDEIFSYENVRNALNAANISLFARAEELGLEQFITIFRKLF
ncbi:MAG: hypothetical protein GX435_09930 [Exilispira sp.]|nr:hypothetical protein [Exilispira sp.]